MLLAAPSLEPLLFRISPRDPLVLGPVLAIIVLLAVAATVLAALRAAGSSRRLQSWSAAKTRRSGTRG